MSTLERCLLNAMNTLADAAEKVQPFSTEARQLDRAVAILEAIDTTNEQ